MADSAITIAWPDQERVYRLRLGEIRELQDKTECGLYQLARRLQAGDWRVDDVRETLRLALIGGGCSPLRAAHVVDRYAGVGQLDVAALVAWSVLQVAVAGDPADDIKKKLRLMLAGLAAEKVDPAPDPEPGPKPNGFNSHESMDPGP